MNDQAIEEIFAARLPDNYEPLLLTFYGNAVREVGNLIVFGDDSGTNICLNLYDGFVYSVDLKNELPTRFVNTDVDCLGKFLSAHQRYASEVIKTDSEGEQLKIVKRLREELVAIDSKAFDEPENWWAVVLEQMEDGLM
jgi:hypothetical protein